MDAILDFYNSQSHLIHLVGINSILALSIYMTLSCAMLSLSNAASAAIGAYTAALLTVNAGWDLWPAALAGTFLSAFVALLLGLPILRLRGVFLAIATIGFGEMVRIGIINSDFLGGSQGFRVNSGERTVTAGFWEIYGALLVLAYFFSRLKGSRTGLALEAIREDESAAGTNGINVTFYKVWAYSVGAGIAGLAGALYAHEQPFLSPGQFGFERAVEILLFAVVGGTFAWRGAILGALVITILPEVIRYIPGGENLNIKDQPEIFTGLILLAIILFLPNGLVSVALRLRKDRRGAAAYSRLETGAEDTGGAEADEAPAPAAATALPEQPGADKEEAATHAGAGPGKVAP